MVVPLPGSCRLPPKLPPSVIDTINRLRQFSQGQTLGGITIAELRDQGRR